MGRRARRFFMGAEIPDGSLAYKSRHKPVPLSELEKLLVVTACGGNTGWHHMIYRAKLYAPHLSNYSAAAGGRSFPSAAGYHTSKTFFTDDEDVYLLDNRDSPACADRAPDGSLSFDAALEAVKGRIKKVREGRLGVPPEVPYVEPHNTWVVNQPGTLLVLPVADLAQHLLLNLCYFLQNGAVIRDDVHGCPIPGIEKFKQRSHTCREHPKPARQWQPLRQHRRVRRGDGSPSNSSRRRRPAAQQHDALPYPELLYRVAGRLPATHLAGNLTSQSGSGGKLDLRRIGYRV
jgi:hypothetical protein